MYTTIHPQILEFTQYTRFTFHVQNIARQYIPPFTHHLLHSQHQEYRQTVHPSLHTPSAPQPTSRISPDSTSLLSHTICSTANIKNIARQYIPPFTHHLLHSQHQEYRQTVHPSFHTPSAPQPTSRISPDSTSLPSHTICSTANIKNIARQYIPPFTHHLLHSQHQEYRQTVHPSFHTPSAPQPTSRISPDSTSLPSHTICSTANIKNIARQYIPPFTHHLLHSQHQEYRQTVHPSLHTPSAPQPTTRISPDSTSLHSHTIFSTANIKNITRQYIPPFTHHLLHSQHQEYRQTVHPSIHTPSSPQPTSIISPDSTSLP